MHAITTHLSELTAIKGRRFLYSWKLNCKKVYKNVQLLNSEIV